MADVTAACQGAVLAEVGWRRADGSVGAVARVPLLDDGVPVLALTYDERALAEELAASRSVVLVVSDAQWALRGWEPLAIEGRAALHHDPDGEAFEATLVEDELRKHPPSRLRVDSLLQRREHWWYLGRLLLRLERRRLLPAPAARTSPEEGVLVWDAGEALAVDTVAVDAWDATTVRVGSLGGGALAAPRGAAACLLRHEASPDLERRAELQLRGTLDGDRLAVTERRGAAALPAVPGWWQRLRAEKRRERDCSRAIRRADRAG